MTGSLHQDCTTLPPLATLSSASAMPPLSAICPASGPLHSQSTLSSSLLGANSFSSLEREALASFLCRQSFLLQRDTCLLYLSFPRLTPYPKESRNHACFVLPFISQRLAQGWAHSGAPLGWQDYLYARREEVGNRPRRHSGCGGRGEREPLL